MSILANLLHAHRDAILRALVKKVQNTPAAALAEASGDRLLDVIASHDATTESSAAAWAEAFWRETDRSAVSYSDVLSGLGALEQIIRFHLVRQSADRKDLLASLTQLGDAIDLLRRRSAEACFARDSSAGDAMDETRRAFVELAEQSRDVMCLATLQGKPFYLNKTGRRLIGIEDGHEIPLTSLRGYHEDDSWIELRDVGVPSVKRSGRWKTRAKLRKRGSLDGIEVETIMFLVKEPDGDKSTCLGLIHRLLDREQKLEQALEESDSRKRAILESSLDPIITIDHRGVISEFNRAAEQVFGRVRKEVLGTKPSDILFPPGKTARQQNRIDRYLDAGEGSMLSKRTEVVAVRANGVPFEAELTMTMSQERGMPVMTFFVRDISLRKRAEEAQRRHAQELERSNRELEQFAYVASHDLQEPLRKIRTFGERLKTACGDALTETGRQCIERMQNAATRMQALIHGLLNLSRVTTKGADFEQVDLMKVVGEVVSDLEVKIDESGGQVEVGKLPTILADPLQMRQLIQNLIGNALKFHREGEPPRVQISARFVKGRDSLALDRSPDEERCRIEVKDNGIGFEEKYLDRIFDVFQRLHPRDVHEGTGVGLAICRKIVERHGGTITAQSEPDHGATFVVDLPIVPKEENQP